MHDLSPNPINPVLTTGDGFGALGGGGVLDGGDDGGGNGVHPPSMEAPFFRDGSLRMLGAGILPFESR